MLAEGEAERRYQQDWWRHLGRGSPGSTPGRWQGSEDSSPPCLGHGSVRDQQPPEGLEKRLSLQPGLIQIQVEPRCEGSKEQGSFLHAYLKGRDICTPHREQSAGPSDICPQV